jgi:hypothetical protein
VTVREHEAHGQSDEDVQGTVARMLEHETRTYSKVILESTAGMYVNGCSIGTREACVDTKSKDASHKTLMRGGFVFLPYGILRLITTCSTCKVLCSSNDARSNKDRCRVSVDQWRRWSSVLPKNPAKQ